MPSTPLSFLVLLFAIFVFSPAAWSDSLKLKSGKIVNGTIRERNERLIQIDVGLDFPITYYMDQVQEVSEAQDGSSIAQSSSALIPVNSVDPNVEKANRIELQGLMAIDEGRMDEGLSLLRQAITIDPQAHRHLNLGSILFGNGVALSKEGRKDEALKIFHEAEEDIQKAIKTFDPQEERTLLSQAYYFLGEMYTNGFDDQAKARGFYKESLSLYENPAAQRGLQKLPQE